MPPIVVGAGLPLKMRQLIIILLGIFVAAVVGVVVAYGIGSLINLYRKHKYTKGLAARKAMDNQAQMAAAEKRSLHRALSQINVSNVSLVTLVPSLPPVACDAGPREKQVQAPAVSVLQVNQSAHPGTPIHARLAHLPAPVIRSRSDSEMVMRVPVLPAIAASTASHHRLVRSPTTITMCDRYPRLGPSSPLPPSRQGAAACSSRKLPPAAAKGGVVTLVVGAQDQKQYDESTAVTDLPITPTTATEKPGLYTFQEGENTGKDNPGTAADPMRAADADANTSIDADADVSSSLLAYNRL